MTNKPDKPDKVEMEVLLLLDLLDAVGDIVSLSLKRPVNLSDEPMARLMAKTKKVSDQLTDKLKTN